MRDLGVSRSSVQALRRLEALDIVTVRQGSGSYVGNMSMPLVETLILRIPRRGQRHQSLHSIVEARRASTWDRPALTRAMKDDEPAPVGLVDIMTSQSREEPPAGQDIAFHSGLLAYLNNDLMHQLVAAMAGASKRHPAAGGRVAPGDGGRRRRTPRSCVPARSARRTYVGRSTHAPLLAIIEGR